MRNRLSMVAGVVFLSAAFADATPKPSSVSIRFHSGCTRRKTFDGANLADIIKSVPIELDTSDPGRGGNEAIAVDLNGDSLPEYFVPYDCSPTGNCIWVVVGGAPKKILAHLNAKVIAIDRVKRGWAVIYGYWHMSAGSGVVTVYNSNGVEYSKVTSSDEIEGDAVRLFLSCEGNPKCCPAAGNLTSR